MGDFRTLRTIVEQSDSREEAAERVAQQFSVTVEQAHRFLMMPMGPIAPFMFPEWYN